MTVDGKEAPSEPIDYCIFANRYWEEARGRSPMLAQALARTNRVLYIEPFQSLLQAPRLFPAVWAASNHLHILPPPGGLPGRNNRFLHNVASALWSWSLSKPIQAWRSPGRPLAILVQTPAAWDTAKALDSDCLLYDAHDDWQLIPGNNPNLVSQIERDAAHAATHVLTCSSRLAERFSTYGCQSIAFPNACHPAVWQPTPPPAEPRDIASIPHPRFLFFGGIDEDFDIQAVAAACQAIPEAGWIILGAGTALNSLREALPKDKRLFLPGNRPFSQLAAYATHSDVCILPYRETARNHGRDAVKLYEYLATGKPVATNALEQVNRFPALLSVNEDHTPEGFARACRNALGQASQQSANARLEAIRHHTWCDRAELLHSLLTRDHYDSESHARKSFTCPICSYTGYFKMAYGRPNSMCPECKSLERHRFLHFIYNLRLNRGRLLYFAPRPCLLESLLALHPDLDIVVCDIRPRQFKHYHGIRQDITCMDYDNRSFDYLIANHVLEHIPDEAKALNEVTRILKPGGSAILSVPVADRAQTLELPAPLSPQERLHLYGHEDHWRLYGHDANKRLGSTGLNVESYKPEQILRESDIKTYALDRNDIIFVLSKPTKTTSTD